MQLESVKKSLEDRIAKLNKRFEGMQSYLLLKNDEQDWHGVMDASADIRELLAELQVLEEWYDNICRR